MLTKGEGDPSEDSDPNKIRGPAPHKRFAVFIDYLNLEKNIRTAVDLNLDSFVDQILTEGRLLWMYVFIPEHKVDSVPLRTLVGRYQAYPILCIQEMDHGRILKDKDTVDFQMNRLMQSIVEHTDITDIVIVSGDADFYPTAVWTRQQGIRVHIRSPRSALSKSFIDDGRLDASVL